MAVDPRRILPTKINLIKLRREERTLKRIRRVMEEKREVLLHFIRSYAEEYNKYQKEVYGKIGDLFRYYYLGLSSIRIERLEAILAQVKPTVAVDVSTRVLFAVKTPVFKVDESTIQQPPLPADTDPALIKSFLILKELVPYILKLAEYDQALKRLIEELKETQRLINALDHVILPSYAQAIKYVKSILEERMREDFVRLKVLKSIREKVEAEAEALETTVMVARERE
ncbi:MAG: V-type ATP synthase subunit D [Acidilobaceae archaeon]